MKYLKIYSIFMLLLLANTAFAGEIRISVAGSLIDAVKNVVAIYQQTHPEVELLANFASSGALAKQIIAGAPTDIYISANPKWMRYLWQQGLVADNTERTLVHNSLVLVSAAESQISSLVDILHMEKVALGSPKSVPAGKYAEQALTAANLYQQLQVENKLIFAKDVRQALLYADRGEVDGAFVFRTDALMAQQTKILLRIPQSLYPQITYPATILKGAEEKPDVVDFFNYLFSPEGQQILMKYGFELAE